MATDITEETISAVLDALVGTTSANADTAMDTESMKNIPKFEAVCEWVTDRLCAANKHVNSTYHSRKMVANAVLDAAGDLAWDFKVNNGLWGCDDCSVKYRFERYGTERYDDKSDKCPLCGSDLK